MSKRKQTKPPSQILREAIKSSGETPYRVAKDSGVPYSTVWRFLAGERSVSLEVFDKLCEYMALALCKQE